MIRFLTAFRSGALHPKSLSLNGHRANALFRPCRLENVQNFHSLLFKYKEIGGKLSRRTYTSDYRDKHLEESIDENRLRDRAFYADYVTKSNENKALNHAIRQRHIEIVILLIENGAKATASTSGDIKSPLWTAMELLSSNSHSEYISKVMVRLLLDKGADPNLAYQEGCLPIHYAIERGITEWLEMFLNAGAKADAESTDGRTPLLVAMEQRISDPSKSKQMVKILVNGGANVNRLIQLGGCLPIHYVASKGIADWVRLFLNAGANPNVKSSKGQTPLLMAITEYLLHDQLNNADSAKQILQDLLSAGAHVDYECLRAACACRDLWVMKLLLAEASPEFDAKKLIDSLGTETLEEDIEDYLNKMAQAQHLARLKRLELKLIERMDVAAKYGSTDLVKKKYNDELMDIYGEIDKHELDN